MLTVTLTMKDVQSKHVWKIKKSHIVYLRISTSLLSSRSLGLLICFFTNGYKEIFFPLNATFIVPNGQLK